MLDTAFQPGWYLASWAKAGDGNFQIVWSAGYEQHFQTLMETTQALWISYSFNILLLLSIVQLIWVNSTA